MTKLCNRHLTYSQENIIVITDSSILNQNGNLNFLENIFKAKLIIENLDTKLEKVSAKEKYHSIHKSKIDSYATAKNRRFKYKNVQSCKNYLFYNNH